MKPSFSSVLVLAILFHLPCLVYGAPFTWRNRHAYYARSVEANSTTTLASEATATTPLAKEAKTTAFVNSTTIAEKKATATKTQAESTASTTIIRGKSPLQTALLPRITDWNSCQGFLSNSGINLFVNQIDLNFDVVINQVTVFEILIDNKGRARETRVRHAFPQPTNYYAEFDKSKNQAGNNKGNKGKATVTAIATHVTETAGKAKETTTTTTAGKAEETATTATESANTAEETATATESANKAEETASATTTTASAEETTSAAEAAQSTASSKETAAAEATAMY